MRLTGKAAIAGVIGWPVGHSRSPALHGYWLEHYGIDGAYVPLAIAPADFMTVVPALAKAGFRGTNVTLPNKEAAFALATQLDEDAKRIGAVNTLVFSPSGITGSNTDAYGFIANLRQECPDPFWIQGKAVVLGAGGAARAVVVALADAGVPEIIIVNRNLERAEALVGDLAPVCSARLTAQGWDRVTDPLPDASLLVNTTSLGMSGEPPLDLALDRLPAAALVTDIVYVPLETGLLAAARARGNPVVDGLGMLLHQAVPGFEAWFGVRPQVTAELRAAVLGA